MMVTIFRSRLMPGVDDQYHPVADRMDALAAAVPGYISHKAFVAADGERLTVVEFDSEEEMETWRRHPEHRQAQQNGRDIYYSEYRLTTCEVRRETRFARDDKPL
jgi:heme-degrading monooxygenase HmoA